MRLGLVGFGRLAQAGYLPAIASIPAVELAALAEPAAQRRERAAELVGTGTEIHPTIEAMLDAGGLDAVVVASPAAEHLEAAALLAGRGIPTLVEKPPAEDGAGAARIADLQPPPWIGLNRRFSHLPRLGPVPEGDGLRLRLQLDYRRRSWRPVEVADDALADVGIHLIDLAVCLGLSGAPLRVEATQVGPTRARFDLVGEHLRAQVSCSCDRPWRERVELRDADGRLLVASAQGGPVAAIRGRLPGARHPLIESLARQLESFAACAQGAADSQPLANAGDGLVAMRILEAVRESAAGAGASVAVPVQTAVTS